MIFEINLNYEIKKEIIEDSVLYYIDNFYKNPDKVLELFLSIKPNFHKLNEKPSFNSIYFEDKRHILRSNQIIPIYKFLSEICNQYLLTSEMETAIFTNFTRFINEDFNDYHNNYWWPHRDRGYNAIVYLNKEDFFSGTNLYENINPTKEPPKCPEHYQPWREKNNYRLIKSIKPKYNRLVLFDGYKFFHGMNICNNDYFGKTYRMNQVFFFK